MTLVSLGKLRAEANEVTCPAFYLLSYIPSAPFFLEPLPTALMLSIPVAYERSSGILHARLSLLREPLDGFPCFLLLSSQTPPLDLLLPKPSHAMFSLWCLSPFPQLFSLLEGEEHGRQYTGLCSSPHFILFAALFLQKTSLLLTSLVPTCPYAPCLQVFLHARLATLICWGWAPLYLQILAQCLNCSRH